MNTSKLDIPTLGITTQSVSRLLYTSMPSASTSRRTAASSYCSSGACFSVKLRKHFIQTRIFALLPLCPVCGREIKRQSVDQIADKINKLPQGTKYALLAPVIREKREAQKLFETATKSGYVRVRVDGITYELSEDSVIDKKQKHSIEIVVDCLTVQDNNYQRLADSFRNCRSFV